MTFDQLDEFLQMKMKTMAAGEIEVLLGALSDEDINVFEGN